MGQSSRGGACLPFVLSALFPFSFLWTFSVAFLCDAQGVFSSRNCTLRRKRPLHILWAGTLGSESAEEGAESLEMNFSIRSTCSRPSGQHWGRLIKDPLGLFSLRWGGWALHGPFRVSSVRAGAGLEIYSVWFACHLPIYRGENGGKKRTNVKPKSKEV